MYETRTRIAVSKIALHIDEGLDELLLSYVQYGTYDVRTTRTRMVVLIYIV